jgi:uncharacterized membrane protein YjjB (DUF3815 family)
MIEQLLDLSSADLPWGNYFWVFLLSLLKYLFGVVLAYVGYGFNMGEVFLTVYVGSMLGVVLLTYFGEQISKWLRRHFKRRGTMKYSRRRFVIRVWNRYGVWGIAFLAPIISPPASVGIAISFRTPPKKIILSMAVALAAWSVFFGSFRGAAVWIYGLFS